MRLLRIWFSISGRVDRSTYAASGLALAFLKYVGEAALIFGAMRRVWTPLAYLDPRFSGRFAQLEGTDSWLLFVLFAWTLPFLWIAVTMTARRAADAGLSPALSMLVLVPIVSWLCMLALCLPNSAPQESASPPLARRATADQLLSAALPAAALGMLLCAIGVLWLGDYGSVLFLATPFAMGMLTGVRLRQVGAASLLSTFLAAQLTVLLVGGALLVFALEGAICLAMAFPPAAVLATLGAWIVRSRGTGRLVPSQMACMMFVLPFLMGFEGLTRDPPLREVVTTLEVDAPPEAVWQHVIAFGDIEPPTQLLFTLGIAFPVRATLHGEGVGAVRHCEFSTGPFIEPITVWDPPRRLAFDVQSQPPPMQELSPYRHIHAPHLRSALIARRGEFRLSALEGGRTRLEGSTWYTLDMAPHGYWALWSDTLIHAIHARVLSHIKAQAEADTAR